MDRNSPNERRLLPRRSVQTRTRVRPNDWSSLEIDLIDFSEAGFRAHCEANLKIGSFLSVEVPGIGLVSAKVIWRIANEVGAKFVQPIDTRYCGWASEVPLVAGDPRLPVIDIVQALSRRAVGER